MARIDKVTMVVRATAGTALTGLQGVTLDAGGSVIPGGTADTSAVTCAAGTIAAGNPIAMLHRGEIVEFGGVAGTDYYAQAGGTIGTAASPVKVGHTIEAGRLVVLL